MKDLQTTDLIKHTIDLTPDAKPVNARIPLYTPRKCKFANQIFLEMEKAGIIARMSSKWEAKTKFLPRKKGSDRL